MYSGIDIIFSFLVSSIDINTFLEGEVNSIIELVTPLLLQLMGIYADSQWLLHEKKIVWSNRMSLH